jgi:hypothetical protein
VARIRSIKPEFWTSDQVVECSPTARLLFIGLWTFADDCGVHPANLKRLKMEVFPGDAFDDCQIGEWMDELLQAGLVVAYTAEGKDFWIVSGWHHQRIEKRYSRYPLPPEFADRSKNVRRPVDDQSPTILPRTGTGNRTGTGQGTREEEEGNKRIYVNGQSTEQAPAKAKAAVAESADLKNAKTENLEKAGEIAADLFKRCGYSGDDGRVIWAAAMLVADKQIAPAIATSAAEGCKACRPKNPPAYFRTTLRELLSAKGKDLEPMMRAVKFPEGFAFGPPGRSKPPPALAPSIGSPPKSQPNKISALLGQLESAAQR